MKKKIILMFCLGLVVGGVMACVGTLYAARAVSPLWAHSENLGHAYDFSIKAKDAYRAGNLAEALADIQMSKAFHAIPYTPKNDDSRWPLTEPEIPVMLTLGGTDWTEFPYSPKGYKPLWEDQCAETFLYLKMGDANGLGRNLNDLDLKYPGINHVKCESVGAVMMGVPPVHVDAELAGLGVKK